MERDQNLVELSSLRINSGRKKFVSLDGQERLEGVVGEEEIAYAAREAEELGGVTVDDVMTQELVTVGEDDSFDTARRKMMDGHISRLVVLDENESLSGIITSLDTLRAMVPREEMEGGRRGESG
ncbi:MAG: CBS domain-containing protein, partial [Candidatus Nanohaloarchaea archaeon]|nr:CBS domain-containing protein [Candidatus Nanohaloarchaea archaeon]